jgi:hypothetical protein
LAKAEILFFNTFFTASSAALGVAAAAIAASAPVLI